MRFTTKITHLEKKAIYEQTIAQIERDVLRSLIELGLDPDTFDEETFTASIDPVSGTEVHAEKVLKDRITNLSKAKIALAAL